MTRTQVVFLRVPDLAALLGVSVSRAYGMVREGIVPAVHQGKAVLIPRGAFEAWLRGLDREALQALREARPSTTNLAG